MENLRSPSLAGIISDPADAARRLVPASQRSDGSTRKQLRVRPGYVPSEDVAKFKVGQGSMKQQLASARENHQAPSTPSSPAVHNNNVNGQSKRPSDFVPKEPRMYPVKQQQQQPAAATTLFKSGAETSRWASTSSAVPAPATPVRITKQPAQAAPAVTHTPAAEAAKSQEMSSRTPSLSTPATAPASTLKFSPSGSDLPPDLEGEWWDDELDSTADALQGINLDSAPVASTSASPGPSKEQSEVRIKADRQSPKQQKQQPILPQPTEQTVLSVKGRGGKGKANGVAPERQNGKKERQKSQSGQFSMPMQRGRSNDKPQQQQQHPPASAPPASQGFPARIETTSGVQTGLARLSLTEITERARVLGNDLREARQLKRYASSGAVLKPEQTTKLQRMDDVVYELEQLREAVRTTAEEVEKSLADAGK